MQMLCKLMEVVTKFGMCHNGISKTNYIYILTFLKFFFFFFVSILVNGKPLGLSNDIKGNKFYQIFIVQWNANLRCVFTKNENLQPLVWNSRKFTKLK
jgi:hypothetical protein